MKYTVLVYLRKIIAALTALIAGLCAGKTTPAEPSRPAANTVAVYSEADADYGLSIGADNEIDEISELLFGIFFEDINFAADGGLYAEMAVNRSFEFNEFAAGDQLYGWSAVGGAQLQVVTNQPQQALNENNSNFVTVKNESDTPAGLANRGFLDGMAIEQGKNYQLSFYAKSGSDCGDVTARLCVGTETAAETAVRVAGAGWTKYSAVLTADRTAHENVSLQLLIGKGELCFDMISLFPEDTYKGRTNGLRKDLGQMLEEMNPRFLRFPGGCVIEGYDKATAYNWKDSIGVGRDGLPLQFGGTYGDVAARKQGINIWTDIAATEDPWPSFMSYGLGFYEYFLLAEDLGAAPVPVLNCGLFCQMRGRGPVAMDDPLFAQYVQDMLDLVEFCRGGADSTWGKVRVALGHEAPFDLPFIAIGNENEGSDYYERFAAFRKAFDDAKAEDPALFGDTELIYSAGASDATHGANYIKSYEYAEQWLKDHPGKTALDFAGATDQHYYNDPQWFLQNTDYYDRGVYGRTDDEITTTRYGGAIPVFLGEYAARSNQLRAAIAEAAYMTGLERNGDIVRMAAYAPLFGNLTARHWAPDLIWYNNHQVTGSINYYVQKLFMLHQGKTLLQSELTGAAVAQKDISGCVGVGTWNTAAAFDNVKVADNKTGKVLAQDKFSLSGYFFNWTTPTDGKWRTRCGRLMQLNTDMDYSETGSVAYFGDPAWTDYTYEVDAEKLDGKEGFMLSFGIQDVKNNIIWNIGGWENTVSCLQILENGEKTGQVPGTVKPFAAETGKTYHLKMVVSGRHIECYIDGEQYVDFTVGSDSEAEAYQVVSTDDTGDLIVKLVNVTDTVRTFAVKIDSKAAVADTADVHQLKGTSLDNDNILGAPEDCKIEDFTLSGVGDSFNYTVPQYSVTVLRLHR